MLKSLSCLAVLLASLAIGARADEPKKEPAKVDPAEVIITGQISKDSPRDQFTGNPGNVHAVRLDKSKAYVIELKGEAMNFNPYLHIHDSVGNVLMQANSRLPNLARIRFTPPKDDAYLVYTSSFGTEGKYALSVKLYSPAAVKLIPMPAPTAKIASEVQGQLTFDDSPDQYREFPGKVHTIDLKKGKIYVIDMMSKQFDTFLLLQDANAVLIAQDDDSGGNLNSRIRFQPPADGRYRLVASTFNGQMGMFTLRVTEQP